MYKEIFTLFPTFVSNGTKIISRQPMTDMQFKMSYNEGFQNAFVCPSG